MRIKKWTESINEAVIEISAFQKGIKKPLKTSIEHFNKIALGGIYGGDIIVIAGLPAHGKSYFLQEIEDSIFKLNENSKIILLRLNYEMSVRKLLLRNLKKAIDINMSEILLSPPKDVQAFKKVVDMERRENIFHIEEPMSAEDFLTEISTFLEENKDKDNVIISIDHIALTKKGKNQKKDAVDEVIEHCNALKQKYKNATFIILSQLNRDIIERTNIKELCPRMSDLYASSTIAFAADIVIVVNNPYKLGHEMYMSVNKFKYEYLNEFFVNATKESKSKYTSFETSNTIFYHYLKVRTPDEENGNLMFAKHIIKDLKEFSPKIPMTAKELYNRVNE